MAEDSSPRERTIERACDLCRTRRVKCDKRQPSCLRCEKFGKSCPGYDKKRKFVDEGVLLRQKYPTAPGHAGSSIRSNSSEIHRRSDLDSAFAQANDSFKQRTGSNSDTVTESDLPIDTTHAIIHPRVNELPELVEDNDAIFDIFNDPAFDPAWFDIDPAIYDDAAISCGFLPDVPSIVDEVDRDDVIRSIETDPSHGSVAGLGFYDENMLWSPATQLSTSALIANEREHEMAYLVRHFTESIGPWMDLFDRDQHFGHLVPLKALRDALLRNAIAAVSAKQLGRAKGVRPTTGTQCQNPSKMEVIDDEVDWFYKAANYYDKAIAFSRIYLQAVSESLSNPPTPNTQLQLSTANSDDLLVAVSIFSLYEALDDFEVGWLQHLSGLNTLLETLKYDQTQGRKLLPSMTAGRRASFWNFARADYQASYINRQYTFLDTDDLQLWQRFGLQLSANGSLYRNAAEVKADPLASRETVELVAHTLLWLTLRVMNYIASGLDRSITEPVRQSRWIELHREMEEWYNHLPATFQPCAELRHPYRQSQSPLNTNAGSPHSAIIEVFFTSNVCAATLQIYHFASILLSLSNPEIVLSTIIPPEALKHAHQILGIALGRPHPAVRVEMLLPLYVAGFCVKDQDGRRVILELLRAIEVDTGCGSEKRCAQLIERWKWDSHIRPEAYA